jgi:hypothetical protein
MRRRTLIILLATVVAAVIVTVVTVVGVRRATVSGPECTVPRRSGAALELDAVQLQHASTINAVGIARGLPQRARIIALATAFQESTMRNLDHGDRDSVGLFQQRPSQGWGTKDQIIDPVYAAGKFYDALLQVPNWQTEPLTEAAQAVQYSGFPDAYAKWEDEATTLVAGLGGDAQPELTCRAGATISTAPAPARKPLPGTEKATGPLRELAAAAAAELARPGGSGGSGGLRIAAVTDNGRTAVIGLALDQLPPQVAGRLLGGWLVAHATGFRVLAVQMEDRRWSDHRWTTSPGEQRQPAGRVRVTVG